MCSAWYLVAFGVQVWTVSKYDSLNSAVINMCINKLSARDDDELINTNYAG